MDKLYKISDISKFTGLSSATLRYYEDYGLLTPAYVNPESKYRYYDFKNVMRLAYIGELRKSGFSMSQIKNYTENKSYAYEVLDELRAKRAMLDKLITYNEAKCLVENKLNVDLVQFDAAPYISKKYHVKSAVERVRYIPEFFDEILKDYTLADHAVPYATYDGLFPLHADADVEFSIQVKPLSNNFIIRPLMRGLRVFNRGGFENFEKPYSILRTYAATNGYQLRGNAIEIYYETSAIHDNPDDYLTGIFLPII